MSRKLISRTLAIACMATTALAAGASHAKDGEVYFYPKNKWTIEHINENADNEAPVCSLSNELNNGYIIQIAGNKDGFTNLNIDFRQNIFKKNGTYEVQYGLPGHSQTVIPTKAFAKNLLVSDLRTEKIFAHSLTSSSVLDVRIQGNEFRMYLTGLNTAYEDYAACVRPQPISAPTANTIETVSKIVPMPAQDLTAPPKIETVAEQEKTASAQDEIPTYKKRPQHDRERYTDKLAKQLKEESKKYQPEAPSIIPAPKETPIEIIEPEAKRAVIKDITPMPQAEVLASARELNAIAPAAQKESYASPEPVRHVKKTKEPASFDFTQPKNAGKIQTPQRSAANIDDAAARLASIEPAASPTKTMSNSSDDFVHMRDKVAQLEHQVAMLSEKNAMLNDELKMTLQDAEQERLSVASENWDLERATMRYNEAERQIMRLGRQLQTQRAQCQIEKQKLETMLFDPELTNTQQLAKLASLETELDEVKAEQYRQQRNYEEKIKILEERLNGQ